MPYQKYAGFQVGVNISFLVQKFKILSFSNNQEKAVFSHPLEIPVVIQATVFIKQLHFLFVIVVVKSTCFHKLIW